MYFNLQNVSHFVQASMCENKCIKEICTLIYYMVFTGICQFENILKDEIK